MTKEHKNQIIKTLTRELGSASEVKKFSESLRSLNLVDLSLDASLEKVANNGTLLTYLSFYTLGIIPKLIELQTLEEVKE